LPAAEKSVAIQRAAKKQADEKRHHVGEIAEHFLAEQLENVVHLPLQ
jgi:hypothetical protein